MRLKRQGILYLIADRKLGDEKILEALAAGVDLVQLREKNVTSARYLEDALWLKEQAKRTGALFLVNDRLDIALLSGADGVDRRGRSGILFRAVHRALPGDGKQI